MIRVAVDVTPLLGPRTGVGAFTAGALGALARRREDVDLSGYAVTWRGRERVPSVVPAGVRPRTRPMAANPLQLAWSRFDHPVIEWWTGRVDVVHGTNFVVPPARDAAEVVTVHELTCVRFPELCEPATLRYPGLIRRALRRGAMVQTPSAAMAAEVVELLGASEDRVRVVPHGVDAAAFSTPAAPGAAGEDGPPYILALGTVEPRKDLPLLVRAFDAVAAAHPDVELVIAGPPGWGEAALVEALAAATHRDRVRRLGWVGGEERAALLGRAALFAYPSIYEGFGLPPLEAMAAGVPVVATEAGAVPEVVGEAARLVPVGDTDALATALAVLLDDPAAREALRDAGRRRVSQFTWERCADGLVSLYRDAIDRRGRRTR